MTPLGLTVAPEGYPVALDQSVRVGSLIATPYAVVEDSRCPMNARCISAGRLVVATRIDGPGWHESARLVLGTSYATHGTEVTLVSGEPEKSAEQATPPRRYRFTFEGAL
jgi:hypothetical protein